MSSADHDGHTINVGPVTVGKPGLRAETDAGFGAGWEPDPDLKWRLHAYFLAREQGEWEWTDHCEGLAEGVLRVLHDLGVDVPGVYLSDEEKD